MSLPRQTAGLGNSLEPAEMQMLSLQAAVTHLNESFFFFPSEGGVWKTMRMPEALSDNDWKSWHPPSTAAVLCTAAAVCLLLSESAGLALRARLSRCVPYVLGKYWMDICMCTDIGGVYDTRKFQTHSWCRMIALRTSPEHCIYRAQFKPVT